MDNMQIQKIVKEVGTPVYIYDKEKIVKRIDDMTDITYKNTKYYAATMANSNPVLLNLYKKHGLGAFVNSIKHMKQVRALGFSGQEIMWTSTGMNERQMKVAIKEGVMLNLDSANQVALYGQLNPGGKVGIRLNIGDIPNNETYAGVFVGKESRIGILPDEFDALEQVTKKYGITISGLHVYLGTQIHDVQHFNVGIKKLLSYAPRFKDIEYLDFGGGFGIPEDNTEQFDFQTYNAALTEIMQDVSRTFGRSLQLILEPGRILAGDSGIFVTKVTDIKQRDDHAIVFVEGSSAIFTRPLLYPDLPNHPHYVLGKNGQRFSTADICGSTTYSRDYLARKSQNMPKDTELGDLVIFENAGSYSYYSKTDFLGIETPPQVLVNGDNYQVISEGENY